MQEGARQNWGVKGSARGEEAAALIDGAEARIKMFPHLAATKRVLSLEDEAFG